MQNHFHALIGEPEHGDPSGVMQMLKQRTALDFNRERDMAGNAFWQRRFYDFNVHSVKKRTEKLRYMHSNPVRPGLVQAPADWNWSSYRYYAFGEQAVLKIG